VKFNPSAALEEVALDAVSVKEPEIYDLEQPVSQPIVIRPRSEPTPVSVNKPAKKSRFSSAALFLLVVPITVGAIVLAMRLPQKQTDTAIVKDSPLVRQTALPVVRQTALPVVRQTAPPVVRQTAPPVVRQAQRRGKMRANQDVAQFRLKIENVEKVEKAEKVDQRDKLLAELDVKIKKAEGARKKKALIDEKIKQLEVREQTQQKALRSAYSAKRRRTIEHNLENISREKQELNDEIRFSSIDIILDEIEQERRRIIKKFPRPGDPKYVEVKVTPDTPGFMHSVIGAWVGRIRLFDEKEAAQLGQKIEEYARLENSRDPQKVADQYVQSLIEKGILQSAESVGIRRGPSPDGMWLDVNPAGGPPIRIRIYDYRVKYVSKAGLINEMICGAGLARTGRQDGSWVVTTTTKLGILIGLPIPSLEERLLDAYQRAMRRGPQDFPGRQF
jgi:hypothetical protein